MDKLTRARLIINEIDSQMASLYEARLDAVCDVISHKIENNLPVFDASRENAVIEKNSRLIKNCDYLPYYQEFLQSLMENSKKYQRKVANSDIVGYQGCEGAFTHIATKKLFPEYTYKNFPTFKDVILALESGEIEYAVVPFENSYAGEVSDVIDLLEGHKCYINKIFDLKISQNLLGLKGSKISDIRQVFSHPQALAQSQEFLSKLDVNCNDFANTALAGKFVFESGDRSFACVASKETAEIFGLQILEQNINTSRQNTTRFVVLNNFLTEKGNAFNAVFRTKHNAGALVKVMSIIGNYGVNVLSIKSKPVPSIPWEYYFYVEIEASLEDEKTKKLICDIENECENFKIIGSYFKD